MTSEAEKCGLTNVTIVNSKGENFSTLEILAGKKHIFFYFSAHWCPPCRAFTPQLAQIQKDGGDHKIQEIIFVSFDRDEKQFQDQMKDMPWQAIDQDNEVIRQSLAANQGVSGIPALHKIDTNHPEEIDKDFRSKYDQINMLK